jgi:hypothetical protein
MKTPKFTDNHRYPHGYIPWEATNIKKTFARIKAERKQIEQEQKEKVSPLRVKLR